MFDYYKFQYLLDFEDCFFSLVYGLDSLFFNFFNFVIFINLEWDDSVIVLFSEDGDFIDMVSGFCFIVFDLISSKVFIRSFIQCQNFFNEELVEIVFFFDIIFVYIIFQEKEEVQVLDLLDICIEFEVIRVIKKKKIGKKKKSRLDEEVSLFYFVCSQKKCVKQGDSDSCNGSLSLGWDLLDIMFVFFQEEGEGLSSIMESSECFEFGLLIFEMKDIFMECLGQFLSKVIDQFNGQLDFSIWCFCVEFLDQFFWIGFFGDVLERLLFCDFSEGFLVLMDFYCFIVESLSIVILGGGYYDFVGFG